MFEVINDITMRISNKCNLQCNYCFESKINLKPIDRDIKKILNFIVNKIPTGETLNIHFTGGEPLLEYDTIVHYIKSLKKIERYRDITILFGLTTNGTKVEELNKLLDRNLLYPSLVNVSWDGIESYKSRKYSPENMNELITNIHNKDVLIRIALTVESIFSLSDSVKFLYKNGFHNVEYYYIFDYPDYRRIIFRQEAYKQFLQLLAFQKEHYSNFSIWNIKNFCNKALNTDDPYYPVLCNHIGKAIYIDHAGDVYPCQFFSEDTPYNHIEFKIGTIDGGLDDEAIKKFDDVWKTISQPEDCKICPNQQCFECPAVNLLIGIPRLKHECLLRDYENDIYSE